MTNDALPGYEEYVRAAADGEIQEAKRHLLVALREARARGARPVIAGLIQRLGVLLLEGGDKYSALALYEVSEDLDPGSLLAKLEFAKFLANELHEGRRAQEKCREIINAAKRNPFAESSDDFGSDEYIAAAQRLLDEIESLGDLPSRS
jgi:hypothetical protein